MKIFDIAMSYTKEIKPKDFIELGGCWDGCIWTVVPIVGDGIHYHVAVSGDEYYIIADNRELRHEHRQCIAVIPSPEFGLREVTVRGVTTQVNQDFWPRRGGDDLSKLTPVNLRLLDFGMSSFDNGKKFYEFLAVVTAPVSFRIAWGDTSRWLTWTGVHWFIQTPEEYTGDWLETVID